MRIHFGFVLILDTNGQVLVHSLLVQINQKEKIKEIISIILI